MLKNNYYFSSFFWSTLQKILNAVLGFISSGKMKSIADTAHLVHPRRIYTPQEENREVYDELYDIFVRLYHNLQTEFSDITEYQKKI